MNETNNQKPKFRYSYLFLLLIAIILIILIFTNTGYSGQKLENFNDVYELVDGTYVDSTSGETQQAVAMYRTDDTIYFLVEGSRYADAFPDYSDYYINYKYYDGQIERLLTYIDEKNIQIKDIPSVAGVNFDGFFKNSTISASSSFSSSAPATSENLTGLF